VLIVAFLGLCSTLALAATRATLPLGENAQDIVVDSVVGKAFVSNRVTGTVSVIDLSTLTSRSTINVHVGATRMVSDVALDRIYVVCDSTPGFVTVIDAKTEQVITDIPVGNAPRPIVADFLLGELYVRNTVSNSISIVSVASNTVTGTIALPPGGGNLYLNANLGKLYVLLGATSQVAVYDQHTHALLHMIAVGGGANSVQGNDALSRVVVNNITDKTATVIDATTDTVVATLPVGSETTANFATLNPIWGKAWVSNANDGTVTVIDLNSNTVVATVAVGATPVEQALDTAGGDLYVVSQGTNTVSVVDANTNAVTATIPVGVAPAHLQTTRVNNLLLTTNTNGNNTSTPDTLTISDLQYTRAQTIVAVEYYYAGFDHYFHSADFNEINKLDDGIFGENWHRTYQFFRVWTAPGPGRVPVCRFFSVGFGAKSSHFYTPISSECTSLQAGAVWMFEGDVYFLQLADTTGTCPAGTVALYRMYNNGMGGAPNHRYTISRAIRAAMVQLGWVAEGDGPDTVFACVPPLA